MYKKNEASIVARNACEFSQQSWKKKKDVTKNGGKFYLRFERGRMFLFVWEYREEEQQQEKKKKSKFEASERKAELGGGSCWNEWEK